jgi:general L-amino acid transport system permease protein
VVYELVQQKNSISGKIAMVPTSKNPDSITNPLNNNSFLDWLKENLFYSVFSSLSTIVILSLIVLVVEKILFWALKSAQWDVIVVNLRLMMVGTYPVDQVTRIWVCILILGLLIGSSWGIWIKGKSVSNLIMFGFPFALALTQLHSNSWVWLVSTGILAIIGLSIGKKFSAILRIPIIVSWFILIPLVIYIIGGSADSTQLKLVTTDQWGGLILNILLTWVGIIISIPLGILLAVGRQSKYPAIRSICVLYIELIRAVPLITILFMAQVMLPLFLPEGFTFDRLARAMVGISLFSAAYMAEIIRGGLQGISRSQYEAAEALGMNEVLILTRIILPQAIVAVIPIIVDQCIGIFRDTTLVLIVGLSDLLSISRTILANPHFMGTHIEVYTFIGLIFWIVSYFLAFIGQKIEYLTTAYRRN